jgi:hypothetical protein
MIAHMALCEADGDWDLSPHGFRRRAAEIRVFGDDIIIATRAVGDLYYLLSELGLMVNKGKSFYQGPFREACGMDAMNGVDVTPAKITQLYQPSNPETLVSVIECSNNLHKKGMWRTADALLKTVPEPELKLLPVSREVIGSVSLFTYLDAPLKARKRWNRDLHKWEYRILTVTGKVSRIGTTGESSLLQFFTEEPDPMLPWESGQVKRTQSRKRIAWVCETSTVSQRSLIL